MIKSLLFIVTFFSLIFSDELIGTQAPKFFSRNLNSPHKEFVKLQDKVNGGNGVAISFFATWCIHCREELQFLQSTTDSLGVSLLVVSVDDQWDSTGIQLIDSLGITVPLLHDTYKIISKQFGYTGELPYTVYIDTKGVIRAITTGFSKKETENIKSILLSLKE